MWKTGRQISTLSNLFIRGHVKKGTNFGNRLNFVTFEKQLFTTTTNPATRYEVTSAPNSYAKRRKKFVNHDDVDARTIEMLETCPLQNINISLFNKSELREPELLKIAVRRLVGAKEFQKTHELLNNLRAMGTEIPISIYTTMIKASIKLEILDLAEVDKIITTVIKFKTPPDFYFLKYLSEFGKKDEKYAAENLENLLEKGYGLKGDILYLNSKIKLYTNSDNLKKAYQILEELIERNQTSAYSFCPILTKEIEDNNQERVTAILQQMKHLGIVPDARVYKCLYFYELNNCRLEKARQTLKDMRLQNIIPFPQLYYALLTAYIKFKGLSEAKSLLQELINQNILLHVSVFNTLLSEYAINGDVTGFFNILQLMQECSVEIDLHSLNHLLRLYSIRTEHLQVKNIFYQQILTRFTPDSLSYMLLFESLGNLMEIDVIQQEIANLRILQNNRLCIRVFTSYLNALCRAGCWNLVELEISNMKKFGMYPDRILLTSVLESCFSAGNIQLFDRIAAYIKPDLKTDHRLTSVLARRKQISF